MKTIKISTLLLITVALLYTSCKEDKLDIFDGETNVYFSLKRWGSGQSGSSYTIDSFRVDNAYYSGYWPLIKTAEDSLTVSVALDGTDQGYHVTLVPVSISGNVVDYDRPLTYTVGDKSTAVEGVHYYAEGMIPAHKRIGAIAVSLDRFNMKDTTVYIDFNLVPNEHFRTNYNTIKRSASDTATVNMLQFRLYASGFLEAPKHWTPSISNYLGVFSAKKVYLILSLTNGNISELLELPTDLNLMIAWGKTLKRYLAEQKALGNVIYEEDGTEMTAGRYV